MQLEHAVTLKLHLIVGNSEIPTFDILKLHVSVTLKIVLELAILANPKVQSVRIDKSRRPERTC